MEVESSTTTGIIEAAEMSCLLCGSVEQGLGDRLAKGGMCGTKEREVRRGRVEKKGKGGQIWRGCNSDR